MCHVMMLPAPFRYEEHGQHHQRVLSKQPRIVAPLVSGPAEPGEEHDQPKREDLEQLADELRAEREDIDVLLDGVTPDPGPARREKPGKHPAQ